MVRFSLIGDGVCTEMPSFEWIVEPDLLGGHKRELTGEPGNFCAAAGVTLGDAIGGLVTETCVPDGFLRGFSW